MELDLNRLILGDCLEVLKTFPDNFFDSCVSDVPYGLGTKEPTPEEIISYLREGDMGRLRQGKKNCANSILRAAIVPESDDLDTKVRDQVVPFKVRVHQPAVMMGGIVKFDDQSILGKEEIHSVGSVFEFEDLLVDDFNVVSLEEVQDRKFSLRERETFSGCVEMCRCFTSIGSSLFRMVVGFVDNSFGQTTGSPSVMTFGATEIRAVLTLDVTRRTGELTFTSGTDDLNSLLLLPATENVGAFSGTGGLSSLVQSFFSGEIRLPTDRTIPLCVEVPTSLLDRFHSPLESHKDFMGKDWSIPSVNVWKEVYRVLKPGGHVLAFAGTRTWDLISLGLRSAGFEKRDTIADNHPALQWVYASGMPKSTNVGKAIAKLEEATDEQKKSTQGLGSGLKPSWEPILVFRKPFKGPLTKNVLTYGTGALNIDATRVKHSSAKDFEDHKRQVDAVRAKGGVRGDSWKNSSDLSGANEVHEGGRWPANLLLTHVQYAEYWKLRPDAPLEVKQEYLAYYGAKQALLTLWHSVLGDAFRAEEAEVLLAELCRSVQEVSSEDRVGTDDLPSMFDSVRGSFSLGKERASEVLLEGLSQPSQLWEQEPVGGASHGSRLGEDAGRRYWEILERKLLSVEGGSLSVSPGVCLRYGGYLAGDNEGVRFSDGEFEQEVHCGTQSSGRSTSGETSAEKRSGPPHKRPQNRQLSEEPRGGTSGCPQSGSSGDRAEGSSLRSSVGSLADGKLDLEVEAGRLRVDHRSWFELSRSKGCFHTNDGWNCHPGCPIRILDEQSGDRPSTLTGRADPNTSHAHPGTEFNPNSTFLGERDHHSNVYADNGGASRFFQQFPSELKEPFFYVPKANRMEASLGEFKVLHPTLKPIRLMAYLIKLVTPVGGLVLDPYCGSGSTCHAALVEGYSYIGIEKDPEVYEEATRRMKIVHDHVANEQHGMDLFDLAMSMDWAEE